MENRKLEFLKNTDIRGVVCESSCDYSLPDYKGDVKRVLFTRASVIPSARYSDGTEISGSGIVLYSVIYLNGENTVEGVKFSSEYDFNYKHPACDSTDIFSDTRLSNLSVRLTGPRRFSAKCTLSTDVSLLEAVSLDADYGDGAELKTRDISVMKCKRVALPEREYAEKIITLDGVIADDVRIIGEEASVNIISVTRTGASAVIKGNISVCAVLSYADVPPYFECKSIPFEESLELDGAGDYAKLLAKGNVTSLNISVNAEDFSSDITADVIVELELTVCENSEVTVATDGYYRSCDASQERDELRYTELIDCQTAEERVNVKVPIEETGMASPREIVFIFADIKPIDTVTAAKGMTVNAELRISGIVSEGDDAGGLTYSGFKYTAPISLNVACKDAAEGALSAPMLSVMGVSGAIDRDVIDVSADIGIAITVTKEETLSRLSSMSVLTDTMYENCASRITVYYPSADEDLFTVAKKFHTTVKEIAVNNALTESVLSRQDGKPQPLGKLIIK